MSKKKKVKSRKRDGQNKQESALSHELCIINGKMARWLVVSLVLFGVQAEAQVQFAFRLVRRQLADQIAFGSESLKSFQLDFEVGHDAGPLTATRETGYAFDLGQG